MFGLSATARSIKATPAAIKNVLLDAANYKKIVPSLIRADVSRTAEGLSSVEWEVEVPQRLGLYAIWMDAHGEGLPPGSSVKPDRIIRSLSELLP